MKCTFSRAWKKLKEVIQEGKTSWGKVELQNLMFEVLHNVALEDDEERHNPSRD